MKSFVVFLYLLYYFSVSLCFVSVQIPVSYIHFGNLPLYLQAAIEISSHNNPVVVFRDQESFYNDTETKNSTKVTYVNVNHYFREANEFSKIYKYLTPSADGIISRQHYEYELRCFQRWFVLKEYLEAQHLDRIFYSDSDSIVFTNMTEVCGNQRGKCSAIVNIEDQLHDFHWVGAGESSSWTLIAITDLCQFITAIYKSYVSTLELKYKAGSIVCDMSVIWLWWVALKRNEQNKWEYGTPFETSNPAKFENAFRYSKSLSIPSANIDGNITVCNGMDVVQGSAFDHYHGFNKLSYEFDRSKGAPYAALSYCMHSGGKPESLTKPKVGIIVNNFHYQGGQKKRLVQDVCSFIHISQQPIENPNVRAACK